MKNWDEYKKWTKEVKKYLKTPKPLLSNNNVIDIDKAVLKDSYGNFYQAKANTQGKYSGLVKIKKGGK